MSINDISLRNPTKEEIEALDKEEPVRSYTIYFYKCFKCQGEFRSNLSPSEAICPFTPKIHDRKTRAIAYLGEELRSILPNVMNPNAFR